MLLHAAIVPPRRVLDPVAEVVRTARAAAPREQPTSRKGFLARRGKRGTGTASPSSAQAATTMADALELVAPEAMALPVAGFGNVTSGDAVRLTAALKTAAAGSSGATVRIAGGTALEFPEDRNVWARLEGDLDALKAMAREVTQVVEQLGFFVDRRRFRPMLCVATVTDATTAPALEAAVEALEAFSGEPWSVDHVWLMKAFYDSAQTGSAEVDRFPLASG
jgi:2'-5' RNA ligase